MRLVLALVLALTMFVGVGTRVARLDGGVGRGVWSVEQLHVIQMIYEEAEFWGLRDEDRDLLLRVAFRETGFGLDRTGDWNGERDLSIGIFQFHEGGVWWSTPCAPYGLGARWDDRMNVHCAAWAFNKGMQSHWRPWERVRWLASVPPDPRKGTDVNGKYER